ncbi:MAG: sigma-70 family RNA polymerase sigma factor [Clostridia bacterium]|nr:sigma-70 family RNA polymerase sigma factor [Clostridia bacterium]
MSADKDRGKAPMNEERFNELYRAYAGDVLRVSCFYLGDRQKAEDVTQDVFVRLIRSNPDLLPGKEKAWLLTVALNRCRDLWRENWFRRVVVGSEALERKRDPHDMDEDIEKRELKEAVRGLPPAFRDVVLLHYYQGMGITEIAGILGVPEGTVSSRLSRARKRLEEDLKGE